MTGRRPRLLVLNQYYAPGVEATARMLSDLCEALAEDFDITVVTGRLRDHEDEPDFEIRNGVTVIRVHSTSYDRAPLHKRAVNYFTYLARALRRGLRAPRPNVVLCMTDPPLVGDVGLIVSRRFRVPLVVVSQDVFPEVAVAVGRLTNPVLIRLLGVLTSLYLRLADTVVAIGPVMAKRLESKGVRSDRIDVIPNWTDVTRITPQPRGNEWAVANGLVDRFVVMHSGNVGHAHNLDPLVHAAVLLDDLDSLEVVIVGFGARHAHVKELARDLRTDRVRFLPYQAESSLPSSLSTADVHYVGLSPGLAGFVVPSRVYGILAAGRPILAAAEEDSETAQLVREIGCGIVVAPDRSDLIASAIRDLARGVHDLEALGRCGREWVERQANRDAAIQRYRTLLEKPTPVRDTRR